MDSRNDNNSIISYNNHQSSSQNDLRVYKTPSNPTTNPNLDHQDLNPDSDPNPASNSRIPSSASPSAVLPQTAVYHRVQEGGGEEGVRYRECLKNHAASMGTRVVDGCGEFMPNGEYGTPESLKCAACDCHRNFHRKEENSVYPLLSVLPPPQQPRPHSFVTMPTPLPPPPPSHRRTKNNSPATPIMMSFGYGGGGGAESSSEDMNVFHYTEGGRTSSSMNKKRFRTKFTQDQKEKMQEFAEKVGWRFQKQDEQELKNFCEEIGIKRQVLKVWMHNNKQSFKKKEI